MSSPPLATPGENPLNLLDQITSGSVPSPGSKTDEEKFFEQQKLKADFDYKISWQKKKLDAFENLISARKTYALLLFVLVSVWVLSIVCLLFMQGCGEASYESKWGDKAFSFNNRQFMLSEGVLIALISGTSASIIGLFVIVAKHLFPADLASKIEEAE